MPYDPAKHGPIQIVGPGFRERVYRVAQLVPAGWLTTYGDIGSVLGSPTVARQVGWALAALAIGRDDVPWYRVVNAKGCVSFKGDSLRGQEQIARLRAELVEIDDDGRIAGFAERRFRYDNCA